MTLDKLLKLCIRVFPMHSHYFTSIPGPSGGRYRERGKKQKGGWLHVPGITVPLNREEGLPPLQVWFPLLPPAPLLSEDFLGLECERRKKKRD